MKRQDLLRINATSVSVLALGFVNSLLVPRIAITSMGIDAYGHYALLLGFCLIPTLADLGMMPGLTRELGRLQASGGADDGSSAALAARMRRVMLGLGSALTLFAALLASALHPRTSGVTLAIVLGGAANVTASATDVGLIRVRVAGRVALATMLKGAYYIGTLIAVVAFASFGSLTATKLFASQLMAALLYATIGARIVRTTTSDGQTNGKASLPWRQLSAAAVPEQLARLQSALLPSAERGLLLHVGGPANLAAYDVALRLGALVSAAPAALTEPLVALLAPRMNEARTEERNAILRHGTSAVLITAFVAVAFALPASWVWAPSYYHLQGTNLRVFLIAVMIGSVVNVLSAPIVALMYASGRPAPVTAKGLVDLLVAVGALAAASALGSSVLYVVSRFGCFCMTAPGLWIWASRMPLHRDEGPVSDRDAKA